MKYFMGLLVFATYFSAFADIYNGREGQTYYEIREDASHEKNVVFIHGGTLGSWVWDAHFDTFFENGFNVLRYDMLGQQRSPVSSNRSKHHRDMFSGQLKELLLHVGWLDNSARPLTIVGTSMGASIGVTFAARNSHDVSNFVMISPAYNVKGTKSWSDWFFINFFSFFPESEAFRKRVQAAMIERFEELVKELPSDVRRRAETEFVKVKNDEDFIDGFYRRLISDSFSDYSSEYSSLGRAGIPVLLLSGEEDIEVPVDHVGAIENSMRTAVFRKALLPGVGHELLGVHTDYVQTEIFDFLNKW